MLFVIIDEPFISPSNFMPLRLIVAVMLATFWSVASAAPAAKGGKVKELTQAPNAPVALACTDSHHHVDRFTIDLGNKTVVTSRPDTTCRLGFVTDDVYKLDCQTSEGISLLFIDRTTGVMNAMGLGSDAKCEKAAKNL